MKKSNLFLPVLFMLGSAVSFAEETAITADSITVTGEGTIKTQPDVAYVSLSVITKDKTVTLTEQANAELKEKLDQVVLKTYAISDKDYQTTSYYVAKDYSYEGNKTVFNGYAVQHQLSVKIKNLSVLGKFLDETGSVGDIQISGIQFASSQEKALELQAMEKAIADARTKANTIAAAAGRSIKKVLKVTQNYSGGNYYRGAAPAPGRAAAMADAAPSTSIQGGELTFSSTLVVEFELK